MATLDQILKTNQMLQSAMRSTNGSTLGAATSNVPYGPTYYGPQLPKKTTNPGVTTTTTNTSNNDTSTEDRLRAQAESEKQARMSAIINRLNMMKDEAGRLRGSAKGKFDFSTGEINKNYDNLATLSKDKLAQAMNTLGLADTNTQTVYGKAGGNARRAMESALRNNRMLSRAMGNLGSSYYQDAQGETTNQGAAAVSDVGTELAAKRAAIEGQKAATGTDFAQNDVAIGSERTGLLNSSLNDYNDAVAAADLFEKGYNIDSEEALAGNENTLRSALGNIQDYVLSRAQANADKAATNANTGVSAQFVKNYNPTAPIATTLNSNTNLDNATETTNRLLAGGMPVQNISGANGSAFESIASKAAKKKKLQDQTGYYVA